MPATVAKDMPFGKASDSAFGNPRRDVGLSAASRHLHKGFSERKPLHRAEGGSELIVTKLDFHRQSFTAPACQARIASGVHTNANTGAVKALGFATIPMAAGKFSGIFYYAFFA
jgi:hypothetical protein